jgi:hypothetical protein
MSSTRQKAAVGLEKGQLWKLDNTYIQIVELGKRLIQYRILKQPNQKGVLTRMIGFDALISYLRTNRAILVAS